MQSTERGAPGQRVHNPKEIMAQESRAQQNQIKLMFNEEKELKFKRGMGRPLGLQAPRSLNEEAG